MMMCPTWCYCRPTRWNQSGVPSFWTRRTTRPKVSSNRKTWWWLMQLGSDWERWSFTILPWPCRMFFCFDASRWPDLIWALLKQMRCSLLPSTTTSDRKCCAIYWRREGTKAESRALLWGFANGLVRFFAKLGCAGRRDAVERAIHEAQCFVRANLSVASVAFGFGTVVKVSAGPAPGQFRQQHVAYFRFRFYNSTLAERKERGGVFFYCFHVSIWANWSINLTHLSYLACLCFQSCSFWIYSLILFLLCCFLCCFCLVSLVYLGYLAYLAYFVFPVCLSIIICMSCLPATGNRQPAPAPTEKVYTPFHLPWSDLMPVFYPIFILCFSNLFSYPYPDLLVSFLQPRQRWTKVSGLVLPYLTWLSQIFRFYLPMVLHSFLAIYCS